MRVMLVLLFLVGQMALSTHIGQAAETDGVAAMAYGNAAHTGEMPGPGPEGEISKRWAFPAVNGFSAAPSVVDGVVYAVDNDTRIHAIDAESGEERETFSVDEPVYGAPAVAGGIVYVTGLTSIHAFDAVSGDQLWVVDTGYVGGVAPAVVDGVVYVVFGWNLYALDAATGAQRWVYETEEYAFLTAAVGDEAVYLGELIGDPMTNQPLDGAVHAVDLMTGKRIWTYPAGGPVYRVAVADGVVYAGSGLQDLTYHAIDAATGEQQWVLAVTGEYPSQPTVVDGVVYLNLFTFEEAIGEIVAIDGATGEQRWSFSDPGIFSGTSFADGVVYTATSDGTIYAIDPETGLQRWTYKAECSIWDVAPVVVDWAMYVPCASATEGGEALLLALVGSGT